MKVRAARGGDGERALAIWAAAVDATHDFLSPADREAIGRDVAHFLPDAPMWVLVGENDSVIGFMIVDGARMEALFVDPAVHRRGAGRLLVEHALAVLGVERVDVNEQNGGALAFYRRLGFVVAGRSERDGQGRPYALLHLRHSG